MNDRKVSECVAGQGNKDSDRARGVSESSRPPGIVTTRACLLFCCLRRDQLESYRITGGNHPGAGHSAAKDGERHQMTGDHTSFFNK